MILLDACQKWVGMVLHDVPPSILNRKSCKACNARIGVTFRLRRQNSLRILSNLKD
jgi:hypothetical protein